MDIAQLHMLGHTGQKQNDVHTQVSERAWQHKAQCHAPVRTSWPLRAPVLLKALAAMPRVHKTNIIKRTSTAVHISNRGQVMDRQIQSSNGHSQEWKGAFRPEALCPLRCLKVVNHNAFRPICASSFGLLSPLSALHSSISCCWYTGFGWCPNGWAC